MPSSPPLRWADLPGRRVGVWGVGVEGRATLAKLASLGVEPTAVVADAASPVDPLAGCDVVVKSPGISRYSAEVADLEASGVAVVGGLGLWLEEVGPERVIGVTGTKGKSTTTSIAGHLAAGLGQSCIVGGNIGAPPWAPDPATASAPAAGGLFVIEISSYQATDLWSSPAVMAVTSLHPDHLNWHGTVERYFEDKLGACGRPGARITVANGADDRLRARAAQLRPGPRWVTATDAPWTAALGLRGRHNHVNALIAAACLEEMGVEGAADPERLAAAAQGYQPLPHRLQTIAVVDGVEFVDDSLSTNVLPTIAAAEAFGGRPLALLVGGFDRDIDYGPLAEFVVDRAATTPTWVFTLPQNGDRIGATVRAAGGEATPCADLTRAVHEAAAMVPPGGVVLLSPAAASYGLYPHYLARSEAFAAAVAGLSAG